MYSRSSGAVPVGSRASAGPPSGHGSATGHLFALCLGRPTRCQVIQKDDAAQPRIGVDRSTLVSATYEGRKYRDQLVCHWANAGHMKVPWNLDAWRPDVGYTRTVAAGCNPNP
ncbi:hypothetical protein DEJ24_07555 [Curtobacterium sp. MCPF17_001]|uniref:DUF2599 domain-containing protein n=1 Tax=Curtobacterium sp. MCPF17_001 TaxID=2175651 RepID=UPI000DAA6B59|nr:hypothetical protein DEJ24_07555 [Curtobacterium sp. MCPF17_001]